MRSKLERYRTEFPVELYEICAFKPGLAAHVAALTNALRETGSPTPDRKREGFYELDCGEHWYYLHVYEPGRKIYLVARGRDRGALNRPAA